MPVTGKSGGGNPNFPYTPSAAGGGGNPPAAWCLGMAQDYALWAPKSNLSGIIFSCTAGHAQMGDIGHPELTLFPRHRTLKLPRALRESHTTRRKP
jgi:hypothetical protein